MKRYFMRKIQSVNVTASPDEISKYWNLVIFEMEKMGATQEEIELVQVETILNSIINKRKPEDVAWAVLQ